MFRKRGHSARTLIAAQTISAIQTVFCFLGSRGLVNDVLMDAVVYRVGRRLASLGSALAHQIVGQGGLAWALGMSYVLRFSSNAQTCTSQSR